ncbi:TonB-dependent receptor [Novosphingobium tardum]|uniref:TonB-dependent receptor n=1 Tax=Novosphingobium tardum TaxID=1538021 RepID=A0ABV8RRG3_9SPHN
MTARSAASLAAIAAALAAAPAFAQDAATPVPPTADTPGSSDPNTVVPAPTDTTTEVPGDQPGEIVVVASRVAGQVQTDKAPIQELDEKAVASYGAGSLADLLSALAPQTGSGRGRGGGGAVVLLNGQRISGFRELRNFPPEAIRKVEILPEEVALQFGYPPDQRVVNFILKDQFASLTAEAQYGIPTAGGFSTGQLETSLVKISGQSRLNLTGTIADGSPLTEAERKIIQPAPTGAIVTGDPAEARYRTLIPDTHSIGVNATFARPLGQGTSFSMNGALSKDYTRSLFGLNGVTLAAPDGTTVARSYLYPNPLTRQGETVTAQAGAALSKQISGWRLAVTADYSHVDSVSRTDRRADAAAVQALVSAGFLSPTGAIPTGSITTLPDDRAKTVTDTGTSLVTFSGRPFRMPAGEASLTAKAGFDYRAINSSNTRAGSDINLHRSEVSGGLNLDLPLTSRREDVLAGVGDLSLNLNADVDHLSDFGTLYGYGAGLTWSPTERLTFQASFIGKDAAPGLSDLGGAVLTTPNVTVFDFARGETVLATITSGGNPQLVKERQRDWKLGVNWRLPFLEGSNFVAEYFRNRSYDTTNAFPLLTPAVEAAFPGRVTRDASGRLIAIDQRPVTFEEERGERLRYGFNLSGAFGKADPNATSGRFGMGGRGGGGGGDGPRRAPGTGGPGGGGGGPRMGGGGRGFGGGGDGRGRWNVSIYHTIRFEQSVRIADNGPLLDLLDGDAISGGGVARHGIELEGGGFYRGFGLRASANYTGGTHIDGSGLPGSTRLDFAPLAKFDLRLFADLGQQKSLVKSVPFFENTRVSLRVNNLFDAQQRVTDANGLVPLRYQPGFLDPQGRVVRIELRKMF